MTQVRTRFSPSPTGALHLGGAHTALFNWLYSRHHDGVFILRIEDTDKERSKERFVDEITESMLWLGLDWDEGPYRQSERLPLYHDYIKRLVDDGHAYYCDCDPEDLEIRRQAALARGEKPRYDRRCREQGLAAGPNTAVRFKTPETGTTHWEDQIKGHIAFDNQELDDLVILRADGIPTYNLAVVVDDITMGVTHIIRGDDHISNTPRQILIYQALETEPPLFGHMPLMLGKDKAKLSKRHGALPVLAYRDRGILPQALNNFLARLGWSHGDQEIFSMDELIKYFDLDHVGKAPGVFDDEKLLWLNSHYIKETSPRELAPSLVPFLAQIGVKNSDLDLTAQVVATLNKRSKTLAEMAEGARFYFFDPRPYDEKGANKFLKPQALPLLEEAARRLEGLPELSEETITAMLQGICEGRGCKLVELAQPVRVALTGKTASPSLTELIPILGKEESLRRIQNAIDYIKRR